MNRFCTFPLSQLSCSGTDLGNCRAALAGESRVLDLERDETAWVAACRTAAAALELEITLDEPERLWTLLLARHPRWDAALLETAVAVELRPVDEQCHHGIRFPAAYPALPETGNSTVTFRIVPDASGVYGRKFSCSSNRSDAAVIAANAALPEQLTAALGIRCGWEVGTTIACGRFPLQARFGFGLFWKTLEPDLNGRIGRSEWVLAGRAPLDRRDDLDGGLLQALSWLDDCSGELNRAGAEGWFAAEAQSLHSADPAGERGEILHRAELHFALQWHAFSVLS